MRKVSTTRDQGAVIDEILATRRIAIAEHDLGGIIGHGHYVLLDEKGRTKQQGVLTVGKDYPELIVADGVKALGSFKNLITDTGDQYYAQRGASVAVNVPTGMRLGTGSTAVAKNGAGAAIVTYTNASQVALDGGFPTAATKGAGLGWRVTWQTTWAAGVATANSLAEVVLTNETALTNVAGTAANTISRALLSPVVNKGASDSLVVTWYHDLLGA